MLSLARVHTFAALGVACAVLALGFAARAARAEDGVFLRANDLSTFHRNQFAVGYAVEPGRNFLAATLPEELTVQHRLRAAWGITDWLALSLEQSLTHHVSAGTLSVGVLMPELRLSLARLLGRSAWAADFSAFVSSRIRLRARRGTSIILGFGTGSMAGPLHLTANIGMEASVGPGPQDTPASYGARYDLAAGYEATRYLLLSLEAWGYGTWTKAGSLDQEHKVGPSLVAFFGWFRAGMNVSVGVRDQADQGAKLELSTMVTFAVQH